MAWTKVVAEELMRSGQILDVFSILAHTLENTIDRQNKYCSLTFQFQLFPTKTFKKGGAPSKTSGKSHEETLNNA